MNRARALWAWVQFTLPMRAWQRYSDARGNVLAAGMAYFAFFAMVPMLIVGFSVLGLVLGSNPHLQTELADTVNNGLGTTVVASRPGERGLVTISLLTSYQTLSWAGVIALVVLLLSGLGFLAVTREGVRAIFGQPAGVGHPVLVRLGDAVALVTLGVAVLVSTAVDIGAQTASREVLTWLGLQGSAGGQLTGRMVVALASFVVDAAVFLALFRLLPGVPVPLRDLIVAALVASFGLGVLKLFGGLLLSRTNTAQLLASVSAIVIGLLIWLNLVARLTLVAAALGATTAADRGHIPAAVPVDHSADVPAGVPAAVRATTPAAASSAQARVAPARPEPATAAPPRPSFGRRAEDRTAIAAGAVLGAGAVVSLRVVGRAARAVRVLVTGTTPRTG